MEPLDRASDAARAGDQAVTRADAREEPNDREAPNDQAARADIALGPHHDLGAAVLLVQKHFVSSRRIVQPHVMADNERRIDRAIFDQ